MKRLLDILEQHREEGRFKPTIPRTPKNKGIGPRKTIDSANVKLKENEDMTEETEQLDEISKETTGSYVDKVSKKQLADEGGYKPNMFERLPKKRQQGLTNAYKRLQVEETDYTLKKTTGRDWKGNGFGTSSASHELHCGGKSTGINLVGRPAGGYCVNHGDKRVGISSSLNLAKDRAIDYHKSLKEEVEQIDESIKIVDRDSDLDQEHFKLHINGKPEHFVHHNYENSHATDSKKEIHYQVKRQLKHLSPEHQKAVTNVIHSSYRMKEEVEQIDEISKQTLGSYIKKASHDVATKGALTRHFAEKGEREKKSGDYSEGIKNSKKSDKIFNKSWKRRENMAKAVDRLTKEEAEQLNELSPETKSSYLQKAKSQVKELKPWTKKGEYKDIAKRMVTRREKGISRFNEDSVVEEGVKSVYHNFMAKRASRKADDAYDMDDEKEFQKQVDKSEYHRVKAGGKPYKINTNRPDSKFILKKEETEQIDEMSGAGMTTKDMHKHLKKAGWQLSRTKGGHDVFTHPKSKNNIAVPRHRGDLKAPTVLGIMKASKIEEGTIQADAARVTLYADDPSRPTADSPRKAKQVKEEFAGWIAHYNGKKHEIQKHEAKDLWGAKQKAIEHFKVPKSKHGLVAIKPGFNEETDLFESRQAQIVREVFKKAKEEKKGTKDKFEPDPELTSEIIK